MSHMLVLSVVQKSGWNFLRSQKLKAYCLPAEEGLLVFTDVKVYEMSVGKHFNANHPSWPTGITHGTDDCRKASHERVGCENKSCG